MQFVQRVYVQVESRENLNDLFGLFGLNAEDIQASGFSAEHRISMKLLSLLQEGNDEKLCVFLEALLRLIPPQKALWIVSETQ